MKVTGHLSHPLIKIYSWLTKVGVHLLNSPFAFNETVFLFPRCCIVLYARVTQKPHKYNVLESKVLVYSSPFCLPTYTPTPYLHSQTTNCRVWGCIRFHVCTLSSFDVFPPVSPLVMKFVTSKKRVPLFFSRGSTQVHIEWPPHKKGVLIRVNPFN